MEAFLMYLLQVSLSTGFMLLVFFLFLSRNTLFKLGRIFLVSGLAFSFVIPLIEISATLPEYPVLRTFDFAPINTIYNPLLDMPPVNNDGIQISFASVLGLMYILGVLFIFIKVFRSVKSVFKLKSRANKVIIENTSVFVADCKTTFSFFHWIFVPSRHIHPLVIAHERVHVLQKHWIDLVILEVASLLLWFNPVMIFYKRALKSQHEFLADEGVTSEQGNLQKYLQCLVAECYRGSELPVTSQFNSNSIKSRIMMMTKKQTPSWYALMYLCLIPASLFLMFAFSNVHVDKSPSKGAVAVAAVQNIPSAMPVDIAKLEITYSFGEKFNYVTNKMQHHSGMDFVTKENENIMVTADGVVIEAAYDEIKGNYVVVRHGDQFITQYFHMKKSAVRKGVSLRKGEVIGFVGNTGLSVSSHLHYEVLKDGKAVNPRDYLPEDQRKGC